MLKTQAKHIQVRESIRQDILGGVYPEGLQIPTEAELTEKYEVSRSTIVRALKELEKAGLIERRRGAGSFVKKKQVIETKRIFGVLVSGIFPGADIGQTIFSSILGEMSRAGGSLGCSFLVGDALTEDDLDQLMQRAHNLCEQYISQKVSGVFFVPLMLPPEKMGINHEIVSMFEAAQIPVVLLDRDLEDFPSRSPYDLVGIDNYRAGFVMGCHLAKLGCRNIEFISSTAQAYTITARLAGLKAALEENNIALPQKSIIKGREFDQEFIQSIGRNTKADAIVCYNDSTAAFVMHQFLSIGLRIPDDIRLVGFDDSVLAANLPVPLTTVKQPVRYLGEAAVKTMLERIERPELPARTVLFGPELLIRNSCGCEAHRH